MIKSVGHTPKVKTRLRRAALRLFSERGIEGTPVKDIVKSARTTQPMLYYYYGSKDNLCLELFKEISREILDGASRIMKRNVPLNLKLELLFGFYRKFFGSNSGIARFILHSTLSIRHGKTIRAAGDKAHAANQELLTRMIEEHAASGEISQAQVKASIELVNAVILHFMLAKKNREARLKRMDLPRRMADIICEGSK